MLFKVKGYFASEREVWKTHYNAISFPTLDEMIDALVMKFAYHPQCVGFIIYDEKDSPLAGIKKGEVK